MQMISLNLWKKNLKLYEEEGFGAELSALLRKAPTLTGAYNSG